MRKYKISLRNGESVSYDISAFILFLTFSIIVSSINTPLNSIYAQLISFLIGGKAIGDYVLLNGVAYQITNLCLGIIEMGALALLFFFDRKLRKVWIPMILIFIFNLIRIVASILFGHEPIFRFLFELTVPLLWLVFRNDLCLKLVNFRILPTARR